VPLYEYTCNRCAHQFEELSPYGAGATCPKCAATETERVLFSRVAVGGSTADVAPSACGRCGDPRGPGACSRN
jgi:putative FmdB family regulatory protein